MKIETQLLSSLEKVFYDDNVINSGYNAASALKGEIFSFQIACRVSENETACVNLDIKTELKNMITVYSVGHIPSAMPVYPKTDNYYLRTEPGMYPDILREANFPAEINNKSWSVFWVEVNLSDTTTAGSYSIEILLSDSNNNKNILAKEIFNLEVINAVLPEQTLLYTDWLHCDCIATYYNVPVFSEKHWDYIDKYMKNAVKYGVNMILTPILTPPLDTEVGKERPTVQLVDIDMNENGYKFSFGKLKRFIDMARKNGIKYFEMSHLFTQWGAEHAPKVIAYKNGTETKIFGWDTDSKSCEYRIFLNQLITSLRNFLQSENCIDNCYFHISDEPNAEMIDSYKEARKGVCEALKGLHTMDALSEYEFYKKGLVDIPVVATDKIKDFIENKVENLWGYYCCMQYINVSNRFFSMPSYRNRIIGAQLFAYNISGFLHWGYNFWYSQLSKRQIDPYTVSDADGAFPSGDSFDVYPGKNGPISSIRELVFNEGLQDLRAMRLLEKYISHQEIVELLDAKTGTKLTFENYPHDAKSMLSIRETVNRLIKENLNELQK